MAETQLRCNVQTCRKKLEERAVATSCSHIFCMEHGQEVIGGQNCAACGTKCKSKYDYSINNLQPSNRYVSITLNGLSPEQILEIALGSISFYTYQLGQENEIKERMMKREFQEKEAMQTHCNTLVTNHKAEMEKLKKVAETLRKELEEKIKETEKQREYISNCSRINRKLQLQLESCKRQVLGIRSRSTDAKNGDRIAAQERNFQFNFGNDPAMTHGHPPPHDAREFEVGNRFEPCNGMFGSLWPNARHSH